jgi:hypothetical protein
MNKLNKCLTINFTFPLHDKTFSQGGWLIFYKWIPKKDVNAILVSKNNKTAKIYVDTSCIGNFDEKTHNINNWINVKVSKLKVDVDVSDVDDELIRFIFNERDRRKQIHYDKQPYDEDFKNLQVKYQKLGEEVYDLALTVFNRFISYARNIKGQHWHIEKKYNDYDFIATAQINNGDFIPWCPSLDNGVTVLVTMPNEDISIHKEDWGNIAQYIQSTQRPKLTLELLANSRNLFDSGNFRSAVIEAVTALEVAVSKFGKSPNIEVLESSVQVNRIDINNLKGQIEHMGFSCSIRYLIPMLISKEDLAQTTLDKCFQALEVRNNVVHQGQRDVKADLTNEIINEVSACCNVLDRYTNEGGQ